MAGLVKWFESTGWVSGRGFPLILRFWCHGETFDTDGNHVYHSMHRERGKSQSIKLTNYNSFPACNPKISQKTYMSGFWGRAHEKIYTRVMQIKRGGKTAGIPKPRCLGTRGLSDQTDDRGPCIASTPGLTSVGEAANLFIFSTETMATSPIAAFFHAPKIKAFK